VLLALSSSTPAFYEGVSRYAAEKDWHLVMNMIYTGRIPSGWTGDGIISFMGLRKDLMEFVRAARVPKVELSVVHADVDIPKVAGDNIKIGQLGAMHLLERGYRIFETSPDQELGGLKKQIAKLEQMVGKKEVELNLLKNFSDFYSSQSSP